MSYTTLKAHKAAIKKMDMESIVDFLQRSLAKDFIIDHDTAIDQLKINMNELKRSGMDLPAPPSDNSEMPTKRFGESSDSECEKKTPLPNVKTTDKHLKKKKPSSNHIKVSSTKSSSPRKSDPDKKSSKKTHQHSNGSKTSNKTQPSNDPIIKSQSSSKVRKDVIKWKRVSGNMGEFYDQASRPQNGEIRMARPASLYDNVDESDANATDVTRAIGKSDDVFEISFQTAVEEAVGCMLPPVSPLMHPNRSPRRKPPNSWTSNIELPSLNHPPAEAKRTSVIPLHRFPTTDDVIQSKNISHSNNVRFYQTENPRRPKRSTRGAKQRYSEDYNRS